MMATDANRGGTIAPPTALANFGRLLRQGRSPGGDHGNRRLARYAPLLLLALTLCSVFAFRGERGHFYHQEHRMPSQVSAKNLALAENFSFEHRLRLTLRRYLAADGTMRHEMYSRFPVGGYALVKLATMPFGDNLSAKLAAARTLMLALFCAAMALAYAALCRVMANRWVALGATLLAFSSYRMLFFADTVSTEMSVDLFAVALAFHGMAIYAQDGRFGQLLTKTCLALLLGWHVYGLLLAFIGLGLVADAIGAWKVSARPARQRAAAGLRKLKRLGAAARTLVRSRLLALGAVALLFGTALLGFNFVNEYTAHGGELAPLELPSVRSMLHRTGLREGREQLTWGPVLFRQLQYVGTSIIPFAVPAPRDVRGEFPKGGAVRHVVAGLGAFAAIAVLVWLSSAHLARRGRLLLGTLALSGFCWALPMRHSSVINDYEALFYVGVPLTLFALALNAAKRVCDGRILVGAALATVPVFGLSSAAMAALVDDVETAAQQEAFLAEVGGLRATVRDKTVFVATEGRQAFALPVPAWPPHQFAFLLSGSLLQFDTTGSWPHVRADLAHRTRSYDFIVGDRRIEGPALLTPDNRYAFLYDGAHFASVHDFFAPAYRAEYDAIAAGTRAAQAEFDLYLRDGHLSYLKTPCAEEDTQGLFFLHVVPRQATSLPASRRESGFDNLDFRFANRGVTFAGTCMANIPLPRYDLLRIGTGRTMPDGRLAWRKDIEAASPERDVRDE